MNLFSTLLCLPLFLRAAGVAGTFTGPVTDLHIVNKNIAPDGFSRSAVLAGTSPNNPTFPGPVITGIKGSTFKLNVVNGLTDTSMLRSTSIHWHGIFQDRTAWADGVAGVSQCPIAPGHSFLYTFKVPDQAGTYWYHSHYATQYCDGLRGAFIVYDLLDPHRLLYLIDDETTIITIADWYHESARSSSFLQPKSTLINGLGRSPEGPQSPLAVINVVWGIKYRFRLISMACDPNHVFSIDGHKMMIIEVDGVNVKPYTVDSIQILAGQRYSFVLSATQPIGNYWVRANPSSGPKGFQGGINSAILRYLFAPQVDPPSNGPNNTAPTSTQPLAETNLIPLFNAGAPGKPVPGGADVNINLRFSLNFTSLLYEVNGASFIPPTTPVLLQILSGAKQAQELLPNGDVYVLPPNKVIEVSIPGGGIGSPHPFHLHGHNFDVVRSAGSSVYNYDNPVRRDVVSTGYDGDNVTIRFKTDNAGPWILHCHVDWHLQAGLAVVFAEDATGISQENPPSAWDELCPIFNALPPSEL